MIMAWIDDINETRLVDVYVISLDQTVMLFEFFSRLANVRRSHCNVLSSQHHELNL